MRGFLEKETMLEVLLVIIVISFAALAVLQMVQRGESGEGTAMTAEECEKQNGELCKSGCLPKDKIGIVQEGAIIRQCCKKGTCL